MSATVPDAVDVTVTVVQVIRGGEPDDTGISLAGMRSPLYSGLSGHCACASAVLPLDLWESIERHDLYSRGTDLWVRTIDPGDTTPLPEGAAVVESHTVVCGTD